MIKMAVYVSQYLAIGTPELALQRLLPGLLKHAADQPALHSNPSLAQAMLVLLLNVSASPEMTAKSRKGIRHAVLAYCTVVVQVNLKRAEGGAPVSTIELQLVCCIVAPTVGTTGKRWRAMLLFMKALLS